MPSQASQGQNTGSSLRVVYRDSVVGFRYTSTFQKTFTNQAMVRNIRLSYFGVYRPGRKQKYRRFQISFPDLSIAAQFVNMIAPICPCKPSSQPNPPNFVTRIPLFSQNVPSSQGTTESQSRTSNFPEHNLHRMSFATDVRNITTTSETTLQPAQSCLSQFTDKPIGLATDLPVPFLELSSMPPISSTQPVFVQPGNYSNR